MRLLWHDHKNRVLKFWQYFIKQLLKLIQTESNARRNRKNCIRTINFKIDDKFNNLMNSVVLISLGIFSFRILLAVQQSERGLMYLLAIQKLNGRAGQVEISSSSSNSARTGRVIFFNRKTEFHRQKWTGFNSRELTWVCSDGWACS
jgi:hypothetical protein